MQDLKQLYRERQSEFSTSLGKINATLRSISFARIAVALSFLFLVYLGFTDTIFLYALPIVIGIFLFLVSRYSRLLQKSKHLENLVRLNELEQKALDNEYSGFKSGERFLDPHHPYSYDLDLFGQGSLFQYLNRCGTEIGEKKLAELLLTPRTDKEEIIARQEAVKDVHDKIQFRQDFWAHATLESVSTLDIKKIFEWAKQDDFIEGKLVYKILLIVGPLITLTLFALIITVSTAWIPALLFAMGVQWSVTAFHSRKITYVHDVLSNHKHSVQRYAILLNLLSQQGFSTSILQSIKTTAIGASQKVKEFSSLINALESRNNGIANLLGNSLFLYDLQSIRKLERWRALNANDLPKWLDTIAEADTICSIGTFHFNHPSYAFPSITEKLSIKAEALGHPLLSSTERVNNDFSQGNPETVMIVTGANMAGKSTFLRAVGVNLVLALAGAPVCAKTFSCSVMGLRSGMRTSDSLQEHQSYFYAELYRLQSIMEDLRSGKPLLILLDEILKGTNSTDKQSGSIAIVEQLVKLNALVLLATHDVILGELQERFPGRVTNGCFESQVDGSKLTFDYTLKPGVAQKANATFLMKQMGIIPN